ncbi:MAG: tetratricopeptide repeat protein [Pseudomonadota bacterium]
MADVFREVDEDVKEARQKELFQRYAPYGAALVVAIIAVAAARELWMGGQARETARLSNAFLEASDLAEASPSDGAKSLTDFAETARGAGYGALARFRAAGALIEAGDPDAAAAELEKVAAEADAGDPLGALARLQAARLLVDRASYGDVTARLGDLTEERGPFRALALEIKGLAAYRAEDMDTARDAFEAVMLDPLAGGPIRGRADLLLGLIGPPPAAAPDPADATASETAVETPEDSSLTQDEPAVDEAAGPDADAAAEAEEPNAAEPDTADEEN